MYPLKPKKNTAVQAVLKRGDHHMHIATNNGAHTRTWSVTLHKGARSRLEEEDAVARAVIAMIAEDVLSAEAVEALAPGVGGLRGEFLGLLGTEALIESCVDAPGAADPVNALVTGQATCVERSMGTTVVDAPRRNCVYLAGSFNPLHDGHRCVLWLEYRLDHPEN